MVPIIISALVLISRALMCLKWYHVIFMLFSYSSLLYVSFVYHGLFASNVLFDNFYISFLHISISSIFDLVMKHRFLRVYTPSPSLSLSFVFLSSLHLSHLSLSTANLSHADLLCAKYESCCSHTSALSSRRELLALFDRWRSKNRCRITKI